MRNYLLIILSSFLLLVGCIKTKEAAQPPADLLAKEKMMDVLFDIQLIEARHQRRLIKKGEKLRDKSLGYYTALWEKHQVKEEQFKSSYDYYMETPDVMHEIWEEILDRLTKGQKEAQEEYDALKIKEVKVSDQ